MNEKSAQPSTEKQEVLRESPKSCDSATVSLSELTFSDGTSLKISPNDVVVFVGPNNAGKSLALKEIKSKLTSTAFPNKVVTGLSYEHIGNAEEALEVIERTSKTTTDSGGGKRFRGYNYNIPTVAVTHTWSRLDGLDMLTGYFCLYMGAEERLEFSTPPKNISITTEPPNHPVHMLQRNVELERTISDFFNKAFGSDLIVHRNAGNIVPLHVGSYSELLKAGNPHSYEYQVELEKLPLLSEQGDGMRSFTGVILGCLLVKRKITLLDEPEAFLHPPQAQLIGRMLGSNKTKDQQLFIATHSRDVLHGLLDTAANNVRVIRLQRSGNINYATELNNDGVKELWSDPILRYSNLLDGLFHEHVIICESDSDCRFYQAIMDIIQHGRDTRIPDVHFIHCGGKHRIPKVIKALHGLKVPLTIIADIDALNEDSLIQEMVDSLGYDWSSCKKEWGTVKAGISSIRPELYTDDVKEQISKCLDAVTDTNFPKEASKNINNIVKRSSPWTVLKKNGARALPAGDTTSAFQTVHTQLKSFGIFIVPVGELESFDKSTGNHGPAWVHAVLEKDLNSDTFRDAREFISEVMERIESK